MTDRGNADDRSRHQRSDRGKTGSGAESAEGIHSTKGKEPEERSAVEHAHGELLCWQPLAAWLIYLSNSCRLDWKRTGRDAALLASVR